MPSIDERSKAAEALRYVARCGCGYELTDGEMLDELYSIAMPRGFWEPEDKDRDAAFLNRLADLIDPTEHERTVADNLKIIDRNRELERELVRVKRKLERTRSASCIDHESAVLADKLEDENLELKKRLGCFDDVTPPVSWYASMRDRCERLERELVEAYRRQND